MKSRKALVWVLLVILVSTVACASKPAYAPAPTMAVTQEVVKAAESIEGAAAPQATAVPVAETGYSSSALPQVPSRSERMIIKNAELALLVIFAGLISAWWLFPIGVLLWGLMVWQVAHEPALKINHQLQSRKPLPQRFEPTFTRLEKAQLTVFNSLASAPKATRQAFQPVQAAMERLVEAAYGLCERMTALENYRLITQAKIDLKAELRQIDERLAATQDPFIQREYQTSRRTLEERLAKFEAVTRQLERLDAQLLRLANALDTVVTEVIHLQAQRPATPENEVARLVQKLRAHQSTLETFEREVPTI